VFPSTPDLAEVPRHSKWVSLPDARLELAIRLFDAVRDDLWDPVIFLESGRYLSPGRSKLRETDNQILDLGNRRSSEDGCIGSAYSLVLQNKLVLTTKRVAKDSN